MQILLDNQIYWLLKPTVWLLMLFFCFRHKLMRRYPLFFVFVVWDIACAVGMKIAASTLDTSRPLYGTIYLSRYVLTTLFGHAILLWIYFLFDRIRLRWDWHLLAVPILLVGLTSATTNGSLSFFGWLAIVANASTVYFGLAAMWRMKMHREMDLGWNLKMVLLAFTVPAAFAALVFMASSVGLPLGHDTSLFWRRAIALGFWVILSVGMSEYSPPRLVRDLKIPYHSKAASGDGKERARQIGKPQVLE